MRVKKVISILLIIALTISLFPVNIFAEKVTIAYINGTDVNVRTGPSISHTSIDKLSHTAVTVIGSSGSGDNLWYKITYKNSKNETITGYIFYNPNYIKIVTYDNNPDDDVDFETQISAFPDSYKNALRELHKIYPNWKFVPEVIPANFSDAVDAQSKDFIKLVSESQNLSWRSMESGYYKWEKKQWISNAGSSWFGASKEVVAYYMDPRNFLDSDYIYMFLDQSLNLAIQTEEGLTELVKGTFLADGYSDPDDTEYEGSYIKLIMAAAQISNVSPYIIAGKIIQEQGSKGTGTLISGTSSYGKYYNFMNWNASGKTDADVIKNGMNYAKSKGWTTRSASIIGGAKLLSSGYIDAGQNTYYYQNFNVKTNALKPTHQYAQGIHDSASKGSLSGKGFKTQYDSKLTFYIPVYLQMPQAACERPAQNDKLNNYYILDITSSNESSLSPTFDKYKYEYTMICEKDTVLNLKLPDGASLVTKTEHNLVSGSNEITLTVKAQTGYTRDYVINIRAESPLKITLNTADEIVDTPQNPEPNPDPEQPTYKLGDVNEDGKISISDIATIKLHLLDKLTLQGVQKSAADVNEDGKITISDIATIKLHLLDKLSIKGW